MICWRFHLVNLSVLLNMPYNYVYYVQAAVPHFIALLTYLSY